VSRQFNRIAIPCLYANIVLRGDLDGERDLVHLLPLAYQIFASPARAALVKSVVLPDGWAGYQDAPRLEGIERRPWPNLGTPQTERVLKMTCHGYALNDEEAGMLYGRIIASDNADLVVTLLVANLPNLQSLDLKLDRFCDQKMFLAMFERVGKRLKPFHSIPPKPLAASPDPSPTIAFSKPIDIFIRENHVGDTVYLASFFHLPNLRSICAFKFGDLRPPTNNPFASLTRHACGVQHIELRNSSLDIEGLLCLLDAIRPGKLKTFLYEIGNLFGGGIDFRAFMPTLGPIRDTLETLELGHQEINESGLSYIWDGSLLSMPIAVCFASFQSLRRLKVAPVFIWGHAGFPTEGGLQRSRWRDMLWKAFPKTLEELWLTKSHYKPFPCEGEAGTDFVPHLLIPALHCILRRRSESFPYLRSMRLEFPPCGWKNEWLDLLADFCQAAMTEGVHCTIILTHDWRDFDIDDKATMAATAERGWGWEEDDEWTSVPLAANRIWRRHVIDAANAINLTETMRTLKHGVFTEQLNWLEGRRLGRDLQRATEKSMYK
jgi:hypothetical protein